MKTDELLKVAELKLNEVKIQFQEDQKRLSELIEERGNLLAGQLIEKKVEDEMKIKKLSKTISELKTIIEDTAPIFDGLKRKILSLKAQKEKEEKAENEVKQNQVEEQMNKISIQLIEALEKADKLNSELGSKFATWKGLSENTGRQLFNKKIVQPSEQMLGLVAGIMISEWEGKGGKGRTIYNRLKI